MAFGEMSLPIDIPWKRMGVSSDMIDPKPGDLKFPKKWDSSIAVFYHEPPELPPEYCNRKITYLKVSCTLTNYKPVGGDEEVSAFQKLGSPSENMYFQRELNRSFPCYGALLQVGVFPNTANDIALHDFPYIASFEPRKREMYETVSESGEVLSQSANRLNIGKEFTSTTNNETYDLDTGKSHGASGGGGFGLASGSKESSETFQKGTILRNNDQEQTISTKDSSREKRESFSHSTSLKHIYSLLQGYHIGTNRALFFLQPRPNIQDSKFTFIQGLRRLEGIQEFFLIVNRPASVKGFCVDVALETAHLASLRRYKPRLIPLSDLFIPGNLNKTGAALGLDPNQPQYQQYHDIANLWNGTLPWIRHLAKLSANNSEKWFEFKERIGEQVSGLIQVIERLPDIGTEDVALIFDEYESYSGEFFVLGRRLEACTTPDSGTEEKNVDIEASKPSHLSKHNKDQGPWVLYAQNYDDASQSTTSNQSGQNLYSVTKDFERMFMASIDSPNRIEYGKMNYSETEFALEERAQVIRLLEMGGIKNIPLKTMSKIIPYIEKGLGRSSKIKNVLELGNTTTKMIASDLNVSELEARKIRAQLLKIALEELDEKTIKKKEVLISPISERFEREFPKEKLKKLLQSAHLKKKVQPAIPKKKPIRKAKPKRR